MLSVNLRHLEAHEVRLQGELPVKELDFDLRDDMIRLKKPLRYDLTAEELLDSILVRGRLQQALDCECVRCLKPFTHTLSLENWALHLPLEGEDKVAIDNDCVDLTPFVREDMLLEFPQHPVCQPECAGLKKKTKARTAGGKEAAAKTSVWTELDKLKL